MRKAAGCRFGDPLLLLFKLPYKESVQFQELAQVLRNEATHQGCASKSMAQVAYFSSISAGGL